MGNGRKITYKVLDDKSDPATSAASARDVANSDAVALVGSASLLDCQVNHDFFKQNNILSIQGTGVDPFCFSSPSISPVNAGPYRDTTLSLTYGSESLHLTKICAFFAISGPTKPAYQAAVDAWSKKTGQKLALLDDSLTHDISDYTPYAVKAKQAGCDGIFANFVEPGYLGLLKAAQAQGLNDATFLFLTSAYSDQFAKAAAGFVGKGVYLPAEFSPYTDPSSKGNQDWIAVMDKHKVPKTSFAQGGYLAAKNFVEIVKGIKGDITRESVTAALKAQTSGIESPMVGDPWLFGAGDSHGSNTSGWPVALLPGKSQWTTVAEDWLRS